MRASPKTGAVTLPTGHGADFQDFTIDESQASEDVSRFGSGNYSDNAGGGVYTLTASVNGFATHGAAGTHPGLGAMAAGGGAATFTITTGVTGAGNMLVRRISLSVSRIRAAVPISFEMVNADATGLAWTWPVA